jgi:signal transduction histidine kinase
MSNEDKAAQDITEVLADIVKAVVGKFEMRDLLKQILDTTMNTLHAEVCSIFLRKPDNPNKILCVAGSGFAKAIEGIAEYEIAKDSGLTGYVAATGEPLNIKSTSELIAHPHRKGKHDLLQFGSSGGQTQCRNLLALPLKIKDDEILGVIKVENKKNDFGDHFSEGDQRIFEIIANVITLTIKNAKLQEQREEQSKAIRAITNQVVGKSQRQDLLREILQTAMDTFKAEVCSIFLKKEDEPGTIECVAGTGYAQNLVDTASYEIGRGFTGMVAKGDNDGYKIDSPEDMKQLKETKVISWEQQWDRLQWGEGGKNEFRNLLALPLKIKEETVGVIKVENKRREYGQHFSDDDFQTFKTIANVIAMAIENSKLLKQTIKKNEENLHATITLMAAHKINNQVTSYSGIERQLRREGKIEEKLLTRFSNTTTNLKRLIDELNNFAKPFELASELGNLNVVVEEAIEGSITSFPNIKIQHDLDKHITEFRFDRRFSESILELIRNAGKSITNSGQGSYITISTRLLQTSEGKQSVKITVEDDGPGLPKDKDVFLPYFSTDPKGTGLGLATVQKLVQTHGGSITPISKNTGSIFEVILPIR